MSAAHHKQASEQLEAAVAIMSRERRVAAESRRGEAVASQFQVERCRLKVVFASTGSDVVGVYDLLLVCDGCSVILPLVSVLKAPGFSA